MTRSIIRAVAVFLCLAGTTVSAAPNDFYLGLLQRGINHVKSGNYDPATKELRIAAFGLVDNVKQFEIAEIYLTIASEKLGREPDARHAAQRLLAAERIEPHYAALDVPADVRTSFEQIAARILTSDQVAVLHAQAPQLVAPINPQPVAPIVIPPPTPAPKLPAPISTQPPAPISPIELPSPAPRSQVNPPTVANVAPAPSPAVPKPPTPKSGGGGAAAPLRPPPQPQPLAGSDIATRLATAETSLERSNLLDARTIYRALVEVPNIDHATALRIAEGSYRARDFSTAIRAFDRAGGFNKGEEPYRYYLAVALYETGRYAAAKRELAAALPYIENTRDVARYRAKIEGAIE